MKEETADDRLREIEKREGGRIVFDPQYGKVVHIHAFKCIAEDGTVIYEFP